MAYQIDKTDGTTLVQLLDGVVDTSTDLKLVGRNVSGYGDAQNENFVRLLENFARADTPPSKPLVGQIWFDKNADKMRPSVFDGVRWRNMGIVDVAPVTQQPSAPKEGDMWWDTTNNKLYGWTNDGAAWLLIGPESVTGFGKTKWETDVLTDTGGTDHAVVIGYSDGVAQAVMSTDTFTNDQAVTPLTDFDHIGVGINMKGTNSDGVTSGTSRFFGTATDADRLGGRLASTWANRNDNEEITGSWAFKNDNGFTVGVDDELKVSIDTTIAQIWNQSGTVLKLGVNYAGSGADKTLIQLIDKNILPYAANEVNLGSPSFYFRSIYADDVYANVIGQLVGNVTGNVTGSVTGNTVGNNQGNVVDPTNNVVVDVANKEFHGTADLVVDGMYLSNNQTVTGTKTFAGSQVFTGGITVNTAALTSNAAVTVNNTLQADNVLLSKGVIGRTAIPAQDASRNLTSLIIDSVTIRTSDIEDANISAGNIHNGTTLNGVSIGPTQPATLVRFDNLRDNLGTNITKLSRDGTFGENSDSILPTQKAIKTYVDNAIANVSQDVEFFLDTKDMTVADVKGQLERLAPPGNLPAGTNARILGSYYYANHGGAFFQKYTTAIRTGIGYIGGRSVTVGAGTSTDLLNKKSSTTGYLFRVVSNDWTYIGTI